MTNQKWLLVLIALITFGYWLLPSDKAVAPPNKPIVKKTPPPKYVIGKGVFCFLLESWHKGDLNKIVTQCHNNKINWFAIKTHHGVTRLEEYSPPANTRIEQKQLIKLAHQNDLRIYAWGYNTGLRPDLQAKLAIETLEDGFDGYIFDVEQEFSATTMRPAAEALCEPVRAYVDTNCPNKVLGYSTFSRIQYQRDLPYDIFGRYSDFAMPQIYWVEFGLGTPRQALREMCHVWKQFEDEWAATDRKDSIKPIIPTAQAYGAHHTFKNSPQDLLEFMDEGQGYHGIAAYVADQMDQAQWQAFAKGPGTRPVWKESQPTNKPETAKPIQSQTEWSPIWAWIWFIIKIIIAVVIWAVCGLLIWNAILYNDPISNIRLRNLSEAEQLLCIFILWPLAFIAYLRRQ